ncbi:MBL fold metallo-hydrolase [Herbiconiux sp.]|uniref:MBL fold metallo-hydrolase n=1 Tax=Herbiconiux sp. TaxID=1871186 RepID=UPI0025BFCB0E|nr:MBL fold metallo-hydrolase [Herbiconiux sp.]
MIRVTASNASEYTQDGTNSWIVGSPGCADAVLIDPGPDDPVHLASVEAELERRDMRLSDVIVTHAHDDHLGNLWRVALRQPEVRLHSLFTGLPGCIETSFGELRVIPTPGHTHDSVMVWGEEAGVLFTGDTALGDGPTMIDYPDGSATDYLTSLETALALPGLRAVHPGHGRSRKDAYEVLGWNLAHRRARVDRVREVADQLHRDAERIVDHCYPGVAPALRPAALQNTQAALEHLFPSSTGR